MAASEVLCGRCGAPLTNPNAPCPRCGSPASGAYQASGNPGAYQAPANAYRYGAPPYGAAIARPKNPLLAAALAIVPGLGHFYLGHNLKGIGYLVGIGGLQFFGFDLDLSVIGATIGVPMELGGGTLWLFSIVDAYRTARHMNAAAGFR
ncbi:MAG TPA: hypothetical protein VJT78_05360 [Candidatus Dormibacteraeota bacterium]|nr:hypothetical protein [Candidatus Dormibacteraeota bacterium]